MGLFDKMTEPVFLKDSSSAKDQLEKLKLLLDTAPEEIKPQIEQDIKLLTAGIYGEEQIAFELKNSHIPMYVLHDLYITDGDLSAQIDYLIITNKRYFIIECKNLYGNIEINSSGDFIRTTNYNGKYFKEGIYSPITQNKRHLELIKKLRREEQGNILAKSLFEKYFYDNYRSVVVLANPKTVLNTKYAKKEIKEQVIRGDQLIEYIKRVNSEKDAVASSEKSMEQLAKYFLGLHKDNPKDYLEKYKLHIPMPNSTEALDKPSIENKKEDDPKGEEAIICPKCGATMVMRVAKKGANEGKQFWGCSNYPKCRKIINI